jgi:signal-transduction protein with cAMP-binding, CBS, and nucleotidyltransferase domain
VNIVSYRVKDYMDKTFSTIDVGASVREVAKKIASGNRDYVIVTEIGKPTGMVAPFDIVMKVVAEGKDADKTRVGEVMKSPLISVDPDEDLLKASEIMHKEGVRRLAVVKAGIIYGIITSADIAQRCSDYVDKSVKDILRWSFPMR